MWLVGVALKQCVIQRYEPVDTVQCGNHDNTLLPNQRMVSLNMVNFSMLFIGWLLGTGWYHIR